MKRFTLALVFFLVGAACPIWLPSWAVPSGFPDGLSPASIKAQDTPILESLEISLWPEYDRPEVLVIQHGQFAANTPLPVPVEIYIPARAGQPSAVAYVSDGGERFNQEYTTRVEGDWLVVSFELDTLRFQLEYYDTLPVDSASQRQYTFSYMADYPITALTLEFQVPPTAEGFTLEPPADSVITDADTLVYHLVNAGSLSQGEGRSWTFTYQKDNADLTVSTLTQPGTAVTPASPDAAASQEAAGANNSTVLIFLVAFVALIAVGAAAFWLGRRVQPISQAPPPAPQQNRRRGSGLRGHADALFCAQCGAELRSDAVFCHRCGTPIRKG